MRPCAVLGAALLFTIAAAPGAVAQQPSQPAPNVAGPTPPPLDPSVPLPSGTTPDTTYVPKVQCISSSLDKGVELKNKPWGQMQLRFDDLHKFSTGQGVLVGVIDTGVKPHPYLQNRIIGGGDFVVTGDNGLNDCDGHGTEVAGIIAANPPNKDIGFKGIAPDAKILSIRQSSKNYAGKRAGEQNESQPGTVNSLAQAIVHAANQNVRVLNMSVDSCRTASQGPITPAEKSLQKALQYAHDVKDVVIVASAGNAGENGCPEANNGIDPNKPLAIVTPPWFSEYVISVAAIQRNGDPATFSLQGPWVTVAAPGTEIISLDPAAGSDGLANFQQISADKQSAIQGTSFAAPYVAGLAALIREHFPTLKAKQVAERIKYTASHPAAPGGRDNRVGYGMINPVAALTAMVPSEQGIAADQPLDVKMNMSPAVNKNWLPMRVAVIGSGAGLVALLVTLFVVRTVRRNKRADI